MRTATRQTLTAAGSMVSAKALIPGFWPSKSDVADYVTSQWERLGIEIEQVIEDATVA